MNSINLLTDYMQRKSPGTIAAQLHDLALFASFLSQNNYTNEISAAALQNQASAWSQITWRAVQHFVDKQIEDGNAISSINRRLSTIKNYAKLAAKSGLLNAGEFALITTIAGYSSKEAKRVDENYARTSSTAEGPTAYTARSARSTAYVSFTGTWTPCWRNGLVASQTF